MVFPIKNSNTSLGKYVKKRSVETLLYHNHRSYMTSERKVLHTLVCNYVWSAENFRIPFRGQTILGKIQYYSQKSSRQLHVQS